MYEPLTFEQNIHLGWTVPLRNSVHLDISKVYLSCITKREVVFLSGSGCVGYGSDPLLFCVWEGESCVDIIRVIAVILHCGIIYQNDQWMGECATAVIYVWWMILITHPSPSSLLLCFSSLSSSAHLLMSTYWHFTIRSRVSRWSSPRRKSPLCVYGASAVWGNVRDVWVYGYVG